MRLYLKHWKNWFKNNVLNSRNIKYLDICPLWKCNAKCPTCNAWQRDPKDELNYEQADAIIRGFPHLERVVIEGGEPTLWKPMNRFCVNLLRSNPKVSIAIITNGFLVEKVKKLAVDLLPYKKRIRWSISLNGIGEMHDESRGVKNVFKKTTDSAKFVRSLGFIASFSFVGLKKNISHYPKVVELGQSLGMATSVCYYTHRTKFGCHSWEGADEAEFKKMLEDRRGRYKSFDRWAYEYFLDNVNKQQFIPCNAGKTMAHINPQGTIRPCHMDESMKFGRIEKDGTLIIDGKKRNEMIAQIPNECMYKSGELCNDCFLYSSTCDNPPLFLKWKIGRKLGWQS